MSTILAFTGGTRDETRAVRTVTAALARSLHLTAEEQPPAPTAGGLASVLLAVDDPGVRLAVLPHSGRTERLVPEVLLRCAKPLVVVPVGPNARSPEQIARILVPLDGTPEAAETVAESVRLFAASGADIIVLHVVDQTSVPKFWDQPVHARKVWSEEFLARYCDQPDARVELRVGSPGELIQKVAATEHVDLVALGWTRNSSPGRARTVRRTIKESTIPILLVPVLREDNALHRLGDDNSAPSEP